MAFTVLQSDSNLYGLNARGTTAQLTLPTGVTLDKTLKPRFAVFGNYVIIVNSPSRPITVDANLNVRLLCPAPPVSPLTLTAVGPLGSGLSGVFQAKQTFIVRDSSGALIAESDFGPTSATVTVSAQDIQFSNINTSVDTVTGSRLYRTTNGTSTYFIEADMEGNTQTSFQDDLSDASLSTLAAPLLGTPPNMALIAEYKSRLFGVSKANLNRLVYSEVGFPYAWPGQNFIPVPRQGSDNRGVTGFARRRDSLGVGRSNSFFQVSGTIDQNISFTSLSENVGIEAPDSVVVYNDVAYFLWKDGVYKWDNQGITSLTKNKIGRWFTHNGTFNLGRLQNAFAHVDPLLRKYKLYLASAGSTTENCWLEYDFAEDKWFGPHTSNAFNPTSAFQFSFDSGLYIPIVGGNDGFVRMNRLIRTDDANTGVDMDVVTSRMVAGEPDYEKYFGDISVSTKPQLSGTMTIQVTSGEIDQLRRELNPTLPPDKTIEYSVDLTQSRQRVGRAGFGKAMKLRFRNKNAGEDTVIRGYEIEPIHITGRR